MHLTTMALKTGIPNGIRTRAAALKGHLGESCIVFRSLSQQPESNDDYSLSESAVAAPVEEKPFILMVPPYFHS